MTLIIGLGNPGEKYKKTRHNLGFMALDFFREIKGFSGWHQTLDIKAELSEGQIGQEKIILAKPQTLMNLSGQAVGALAGFYKIPGQNIWVIHDDFNLPLGVIRISQGASCAGHKGVKSIIETLGSKDFVRFRLGIHPIGQTFLSVFFKKIASLEKFVLKNFDKGELKAVNEIIEKVTQTIEVALKEGMAQAMNRLN